MTDANASALGDAWGNAPRRGKVQPAGLRGAQHQRASLRVHVITDERKQSIDELSRIVRARVEAEHAVDEIQRTRLLAKQLVASRQLDMRLLELLHRRRDRRFDGIRTPRCLTSGLLGPCQFALERNHSLRRAGN